jgi:hypothetical protein
MKNAERKYRTLVPKKLTSRDVYNREPQGEDPCPTKNRSKVFPKF